MWLAALSAVWVSGCGRAGASPMPRASAPADAAVAPPVAARPRPAVALVHGRFAGADLGVGADLNGALPFPADNPWNTDISGAPRDPNSDALIAGIGAGLSLQADFGAGLRQGAPIGIPYVVVDGSQPRVPVTWSVYGHESDAGPYPLPPDAPVEGGAAPTNTGNRRVLVIDRDHDRLYELFSATCNADGSWDAGCGAVFNLDSNAVRPSARRGWGSADAAGLPIFPGLARYEEAARGPGGIRHALRFTVQRSRQAFVPPATHWASSNTHANVAPMGMRVRLKASTPIPAHFSIETRAILSALKTHGMIVADHGSNWALSGAPDPRWNNAALAGELRTVTGSDFEVVRMDGLVTG